MSLFSFVSRSYQAAVDGTRELLVRALMAVLIFLGYVLLSLLIYAILRRVMVPQKLHVRPVHLFYDPACQLDHTPSCPFPRAEFMLRGGKKLLSSGQYYTVAMEMELPESQVNADIGVFMVNTSFYSVGQRYLSSSARPAMLHYRSPLLNTMHTLVYALPFLTGFWEQKQTISLVLYENYYEPYGDGSVALTVTFLHHKIQLYSVVLTIDANFSGFTYYLYQWPMTMSVIVVVSIFITLCTCTVVMWVRDVVRDYDTHRQRSIQRRRALQQQQQQQRERQQRQQMGAAVRRPPAGGPAVGDGQATPSSVATGDTLSSVEEVSTDADPHPLVTPEGSATPTESCTDDTASEFSADFNAVLGSLHSLRREIDGERDGESAGPGAQGVSRERGEGLRHRPGQ